MKKSPMVWVLVEDRTGMYWAEAIAETSSQYNPLLTTEHDPRADGLSSHNLKPTTKCLSLIGRI